MQNWMKALTSDLLQFLNESPCNFLAVKNVITRLERAGFSEADMAEPWTLAPGDRRYVVKNSSAIFAFIVGSDTPAAGFHIISAHSDSPGFRIKPNAEIVGEGGMVTLNTEVYGGPILYTWFDRPLSIAGRVTVRSSDPLNPDTRMVNFGRPLLTIPHLAIHFNRAVNEGNPLSRQRDMLPVLGRVEKPEEAKGLLTRMVADELGVTPEEILDFDLTLYDTTPACTFGLNDEFISSGRIDDLEMVHAAVTALCDAAEKRPMAEATRVVAIFDNEETGSGTKQGAASPILSSIFRRICACRAAAGADSFSDYSRAVARSFMISADNGHALHPNYTSKQDPTNHPIQGDGPVVKINANCKYMTDGRSAGIFRSICADAGVPCQSFVNHSDTPGGSTLGNILTSQIELEGVDMGAPQWAMHSVRETAAVADHLYTVEAFTRFLTL